MSALILGTLSVAAPPAQAVITSPERVMMNLTNQARTARGLRGLSWSSSLSDRARRHTRAMIAAGHLYHTSPLSRMFIGYNWRYGGENVGYGPSMLSIFNAFMKSPGHRANILSSRYRIIGAGVVYSGGKYWISVEFYG